MQLTDLFDRYTSPWLATAITAIIAVLVALVAYAVLFAILRRVTRFSVIASTVLEYAASPAKLVLPVLALQFVLAAAPDEIQAQRFVGDWVSIALTLAITWLAIRAVAGVGEAVIRLHPSDVGDNLHARRIQTQTRVLARTVMFFVLLIGAASALMTFPGMRQIGTSLLASAGVAGIAAGIAARPVLGNLIAGLQIALTQPIRLDDVVIMENEWGRIEEITATYVVVKIWDERRLVVPLQWVIEHPFQNWTRTGSELLGTVFLWLDYRVPLAPLRAELQRVCDAAPEWDKRVAMIQVVETSERSIQIRALVSAQDATKAWDLRCRVREALIDFVQREYPESLPRLRAEIDRTQRHPPAAEPALLPERPGKGDSTAIRAPTRVDARAAGDEPA
ncbi:MAG: mechanosensitive ion channel family protein [Rhodospirillaceae bacterium]